MIEEPTYKEPCPCCGRTDPAGFPLVRGWITLVCKGCAWMWEVQIKEATP